MEKRRCALWTCAVLWCSGSAWAGVAEYMVGQVGGTVTQVSGNGTSDAPFSNLQPFDALYLSFELPLLNGAGSTASTRYFSLASDRSPAGAFFLDSASTQYAPRITWTVQNRLPGQGSDRLTIALDFFFQGMSLDPQITYDAEFVWTFEDAQGVALGSAGVPSGLDLGLFETRSFTGSVFYQEFFFQSPPPRQFSKAISGRTDFAFTSIVPAPGVGGMLLLSSGAVVGIRRRAAR